MKQKKISFTMDEDTDEGIQLPHGKIINEKVELLTQSGDENEKPLYITGPTAHLQKLLLSKCKSSLILLFAD